MACGVDGDDGVRVLVMMGPYVGDDEGVWRSRWWPYDGDDEGAWR